MTSETCLSIDAIKHHDQSHLGRTCFFFFQLTLPRLQSITKSRWKLHKGRNLEAVADAEAKGSGAY